MIPPRAEWYHFMPLAVLPLAVLPLIVLGVVATAILVLWTVAELRVWRAGRLHERRLDMARDFIDSCGDGIESPEVYWEYLERLAAEGDE